MKLKSKFVFKKKYIISPFKLTFAILITWMIGVLLGMEINNLIIKYVKFENISLYVLVVIAFVIGSTALGVPIALLLTHKGNKILNSINECIDKVSKGDYTARLEPITKNSDINGAIENFNKMVEQLNSVAVLKNDFISDFSHEFKTPIASIKGYAELLIDSNNLTEEQKEFLKVITDESNRLSKLSENAMKLAKLDSQTLVKEQIFSLNGQLEDCVLLFDGKLKKKNIEVTTDLKTVYYRSDPDMIKEIWINVLGNAVKFTGENGKIDITLRQVGKKITVIIKDNGIGMDETTKKNIFEKFYQGDSSHSSKGIGLGLSIVSRILEIDGGKIECESEQGKGTTMIITLMNK